LLATKFTKKHENQKHLFLSLYFVSFRGFSGKKKPKRIALEITSHENHEKTRKPKDLFLTLYFVFFRGFSGKKGPKK